MRFDMICEANDIEHRLIRPNHPWTNGQVERINRTIKEATVKRFHHDDHEHLRRHFADFSSAYDFGRRLKTLKGLTPYEFICKRRTTEPQRFILNPSHQMPGLNNSVRGRVEIARYHRRDDRRAAHQPHGLGLDPGLAKEAALDGDVIGQRRDHEEDADAHLVEREDGADPASSPSNP